MNSNLNISVIGHVKITEYDDINKKNGKIILDKYNAIHPRNMARVIARALANESNFFIHRIAYGNGGTVTDPTGNILLNPTNDGRDGSWESRLYNETYSEIVDDSNIDFGSDPGSAEPGNIRSGGGSVPEDDPAGGGVTSREVGTKSNVIVKSYINKNEPTGQIASISDFGIEIDANESTFIFDEIGLYSSGKPAAATYGHSSVNVGNKTSQDISLLNAETDYVLSYTVDGVDYNTFITTPSSGSGPNGEITYGDICEGLNTSNWVVSGTDISTVLFVYITDRTGGAYSTISSKESYGLLTFQSLTTGNISSVELNCGTSEEVVDFFSTITNSICDNVNINVVNGSNAGSLNDSINSENERERLLTHIVFPPITKTADKALSIVYTLTVSVSRTSDSTVTTSTSSG